MTTPTQAIRTAMSPIQELLQQSKAQIEARLPKNLDPQQFLLGVYTAIQKNPTLLNCDKNKLLIAALDAAEAGCSLEPSLQLGWLIPYGQDVNFQPSYRFFIQKAYETGDVRSFYAEVVYAGDKFERQYAPKKNLFHAPGSGDRTQANAVGAYALVEFNDGSLDWEYLTREQIEKHRSKSKQQDSMKWKEFWWEGWRITPIRVLAKRLPIKTRALENLVTLLNKTAEGELDMDTVEVVRAPARRLSEAQNVTESLPEPQTQQPEPQTAAQATATEPVQAQPVAAAPQGSLLQEEPGKYVTKKHLDDIWAAATRSGWSKSDVEAYVKKTFKVSKPGELLVADFESFMSTLRESARP